MNSVEFLIITLAIFAAVDGILVLGLNIQFGSAGVLNLAYIAIVSVGAYATGVAELRPAPAHSAVVQYIGGFGWPFVPSLLFGTACATVFTFALGGIAFLRLRYDYLGLTLFSVEAGLLLICTDYYPLFDGNRGLLGLTGPWQNSLGQSSYQYEMLGVCGACFGVVYFVASRIDRSPFGRLVRGLRDDELGFASLGRDPWKAKVSAFVIGGCMAGLGGGLLATYSGGWSPGAWQPLETLTILAAIFVGGRGRPLGVVLGSLLVLECIGQATLFLPNIGGAADVMPNLENIAAIVVLFAFLWWRPQGLVPEQLETVPVQSAGISVFREEPSQQVVEQRA